MAKFAVPSIGGAAFPFWNKRLLGGGVAIFHGLHWPEQARGIINQ